MVKENLLITVLSTRAVGKTVDKHVTELGYCV